MKKVYFISGLGADKRVFDHLDLSFCEPVFLDWIAPLKKESLSHYSSRLCSLIKEPDPVLIGVSLGGMMATEFAGCHPNSKVFIISSNKTSKEFPGYLRFIIKYFPLHRLSNRFTLQLVMPVILWFLGAKTKEQRKLLRQVVKETDIAFIKWAITAVAKWKAEIAPVNVVHIHGTADRILPYKYVQPGYTIKNGEHLMIKTKAKEISGLLRKLCTES